MKSIMLQVLLATGSCSIVASAQTPFGVGYQAIGSMRLVGLEGGRTLVSMGWGPGVTMIDSQGQVIWTKYKWGNTTSMMYGPQSVTKFNETSYYALWGYSAIGCDRPGDPVGSYIQPVLCRMDSSGEIVEAFRYEFGNACTGFAKDVIATGDAGVILWSWGYGHGYFMIKTNADMTLQWSRIFETQGSFQFVKELPNGDLLAGLNLDTAGATVARLDPDGNVLWCKSYIRPRGVVHDAVVLSDSAFVITGYTDSTASTNPLEPLPAGYDPKLFMMKLNGAGEVQWCKGYEGANLWYAGQGQQSVGASDGGYVLMANAASANNIANLPVLFKTDANGDTLWTRSTHTPGHSYNTADLIRRDDGSYMMSMVVYNPSYGGMYALIKTDSLGHFPCADRSYPVTVTELFPVDSAFTLTPTSNGATAYPVSFRDTIFDPIVTEDLCAVVTAVHEANRNQKATIRPNPNTGRFTLQFPDPLTADSFYSVYDAVGKLLYQRPLATGQESEEVDLSKFGKGTYLVRITSKDGVCNERVVVQ